jgi:hypothetical protein
MHGFMTLLVTLGAVGAFATSVLAATDEEVPAGSAANSQQVQIKGQRSGKVAEGEFASMIGDYRLSDGRLLSVRGARQRPTAELGNAGPVPLLADGSYRLASADGAMILRFNPRANGEVDEVTVSLPATSVH